MNSYGSAITARWYADTVRTIREAAGEPGLVVRNYGPDEFLAAAEQGGFDLSIASSGLTSLMISRTNGIPLLTIATNRAPDPNYGNGAAVVTRADRTDIRSLEDLEGMRVAVMSRTAFAGWQVPLVEMIRHGVNPAGFFGEVIETGAPMTRIVDAVRSGRADAGFLVTCLLEGLEDAGRLPPGELAVINEHHDGLIACRHSSTLYPNWLLTVKPGVSSELARRITERLLALPPGEDGIRWTVPTDHRRIYKLFSTLQMPLKSEAPLSWFMRTHWAWIFGGFLALLALVAHAAGLSALVRRRTRQAEAAVRARLASDLAARETALRLDALSRASAVGLISGMVAHELKQPLGVIGNYAGSLLRRLKRGDAVPNATLIEALEEIVRSDMSAADIVDRIRRYAKTGGIERRERCETDLVEAVAQAVRKESRQTQSRIDFRPSASRPAVDMDALEVTLVAANLIRNALEATAASPQSRVTVTVSSEAGHALLTIEDDGPALSDEAFDRLADFRSVGVTTKPDGLGLGVAIIRSLLEAQGASLAFERRLPQGIAARVRWPLRPLEQKRIEKTEKGDLHVES